MYLGVLRKVIPCAFFKVLNYVKGSNVISQSGLVHSLNDLKLLLNIYYRQCHTSEG